MFLDYLALFILIMGITVVFYKFIFIHDLPHQIAKAREHPHEEAIGVACWLSLFTLHTMWPIVFLWAVAHKKGMSIPVSPVMLPPPHPGTDGEMAHRLAVLEERLRKLEAK